MSRERFGAPIWLREYLELWARVAGAGALTEADLLEGVKGEAAFHRGREKEALSGGGTLRDRLRYRLARMVEAGVLVSRRRPDGMLAYEVGTLLPGVLLDLSAPPLPADSSIEPPQNPRPRTYAAWRLGVALAELDQRLPVRDPSRPGRRLVSRLKRQYEALYGPMEGSPAIAHRHLLPAISERIEPEVWNVVLDALTGAPTRLRLVVTGLSKRRDGARDPISVEPRRLLVLRGRPHLEGRRFPDGRTLLIRMAHIRSAEPSGPIEAPRPDPIFERLLDRTWGADATGHPDAPSPSLERVVLEFHGDACSAIREEPGVPDAVLTRGTMPDGRTVLRYEVETVIGPRFLSWVRGWGPDVEVLSPISLRERVRLEALERLQAYEGEA